MAYIKNTAKFGSNYGLSRTEKILELLDSPHKKLKCIHIAGTNGKGSTSAMLSNILIEAGYKVGMYTSPFLIDFEERIQINNKNILKSDLCLIVDKVKLAVDEVIKLGYEHPTEFEIITCAAFLYFYEKEVDYAVIEVGLGGRLDSTNVITPILSVITSISLDHMQILGNSLESIAKEKAGIIKKGIPVVLYPQKDECKAVIEKACISNCSKLICVKIDSAKLLEVNFKENIPSQKIQVTTKNNSYHVDLALLGGHQLLNCSTVIHCVEQLIDQGIVIKDEAIVNGLIKVIWKGRLEVMGKNPLIVIDGAHNIDAIINLNSSLKQYFKYKNIVLILGILADKEVEQMVKVITSEAKKVITVTPNSIRAENSDDLRNIVLKYNENCVSEVDYEKALNIGLSSLEDEDLLLLCGSLYMIGDMRKIIKKVLRPTN
jgi:dihydrofolate synthase/folylpolyglutamate synthase